MVHLLFGTLCLLLLLHGSSAQVNHICRQDRIIFDGDLQVNLETFEAAWEYCAADPNCNAITFVKAIGRYFLRGASDGQVSDDEDSSYPKRCLQDPDRQDIVDQTNNVLAVAFDPSNHLWIAAGTGDGLVKTWFRNRVKSTTERHPGNLVNSVKFSPNGDGIFASAGTDMMVKLTYRSCEGCATALSRRDATGGSPLPPLLDLMSCIVIPTDSFMTHQMPFSPPTVTTTAPSSSLIPCVQVSPKQHTHTHTCVLFGACQLVTLHTQPKAKQARSSVTLSSHGLLLPPPGLVKTLLGTTPRVIQNVGTYP